MLLFFLDTLDLAYTTWTRPCAGYFRRIEFVPFELFEPFFNNFISDYDPILLSLSNGFFQLSVSVLKESVYSSRLKGSGSTLR